MAVITGLLSLLCVGTFMLLVLGLIVNAMIRAAGMVPARGIVLSVDAVPRSTGGVGLGRYQVRRARMDVEIDGRRPFEITTDVRVPVRYVEDLLPGATVAIRVNPKSTGSISVVGPGMAVPAFSTAQSPPGAGSTPRRNG